MWKQESNILCHPERMPNSHQLRDHPSRGLFSKSGEKDSPVLGNTKPASSWCTDLGASLFAKRVSSSSRISSLLPQRKSDCCLFPIPRGMAHVEASHSKSAVPLLYRAASHQLNKISFCGPHVREFHMLDLPLQNFRPVLGAAPEVWQASCLVIMLMSIFIQLYLAQNICLLPWWIWTL